VIGQRTLLLSVVLAAAATALSCCPCRHAGDTVRSRTPGLFWVKGPQGMLRVEDRGAGPGTPVLFVHGLAGSRQAWTEQVAHLSPGRRVVALDLHGMGESEPSPSGDYTIPSFAADVGAVADALGLKRFVLVGHSMSGSVAAQYAADHPDRVAGLLLDDPAGDLTTLPPGSLDPWLKGMEPATYREFTETWWSQMLAAAKPEVRDSVYAQMRKTPPAVVAASARSLASYSPVAALEAYKGPKLTVVTPENEKPYSLQKLVPGLHAQLVTGTSHWIMMDDPEAFDAVMDRFLQEVDGAAQATP
jgi:pimeloyl-ACP methyl ester carboxylesterase